MPYNGSGGYVSTNPPPFVFNTVISEVEMNAMLTDLFNAMGQVLVRDGQAAMTGTLNMGDQSIDNVGAGSAATPSIQFDDGGGFYSSATDELSVATAGVQRIKVGSNGITSFTGSAATNCFTQWMHTAAIRGYIGTDGNGIATTGSGLKFGIRSENELLLMANAADNWRIDTGNRIVNPGNTQAAFYATLSANQTGLSNGSTIPFNQESFDQGSNFNTSTGVFTAPVAGLYQFNVLVTYENNLGSTTGCGLALVANGANVLDCPNRILTGTVIGTAASVTVRLGASQTANVLCVNNLSASLLIRSGSQTVFSGYLIC
jgi:hypothetical protein